MPPLPPGGGPEDDLGDVRPRHLGRFAGGGQGPIDAGGVVSLAAARVQNHRGIAGTGQDLTTKRIQQRLIIPFGEKLPPGGGHAPVISRRGGVLLIGRQQVGVALPGDVIAVAAGAAVGVRPPGSGGRRRRGSGRGSSESRALFRHVVDPLPAPQPQQAPGALAHVFRLDAQAHHRHRRVEHQGRQDRSGARQSATLAAQVDDGGHAGRRRPPAARPVILVMSKDFRGSMTEVDHAHGDGDLQRQTLAGWNRG